MSLAAPTQRRAPHRALNNDDGGERASFGEYRHFILIPRLRLVSLLQVSFSFPRRDWLQQKKYYTVAGGVYFLS